MTLTGFPFLLDPAEKHRLLTLQEHDGLCCLLDRAQQFGGTDDVFFLCMSTCSVLVRVSPDENGAWHAAGFAFQKQQEPWLWLYLPSLLGTVLDSAPSSGNLRFRIEAAAQADEWLKRHNLALWRGAQQLAHDTARQMHPYSIGFTHLDPSVYGDDGIQWYRLEPHKQEQDNTRELSAAEIDDTKDGAYIVPPLLTRTWRVLSDEEKMKLGPVDDTSDWYAFAHRVHAALSE